MFVIEYTFINRRQKFELQAFVNNVKFDNVEKILNNIP